MAPEGAMICSQKPYCLLLGGKLQSICLKLCPPALALVSNFQQGDCVWQGALPSDQGPSKCMENMYGNGPQAGVANTVGNSRFRPQRLRIFLNMFWKFVHFSFGILFHSCSPYLLKALHELSRAEVCCTGHFKGLRID